MRYFDFSSWQNVVLTILMISLVTLIGVGVRLLVMTTVQQRRERANHQINERLRVLIAAYKTLGGSFTGDLAVDPTHLRDLIRKAKSADNGELLAGDEFSGSDRARRMRDAVEGALSDIILLGTEEQVRLAGRAAGELVAGKNIHTHELVVSLRDFIRMALDLDTIPADLKIPNQGPARIAAGAGRGKGGSDGESRGDTSRGRSAGNAGMAAGMGGMAGIGLAERGHHEQGGREPGA